MEAMGAGASIKKIIYLQLHLELAIVIDVSQFYFPKNSLLVFYYKIKIISFYVIIQYIVII